MAAYVSYHACWRATAADHDGSTALHASALSGSADAARALLQAGADVSVRSNLEETPLHFAAREGNLCVAELLLLHGADAHATTKFGATPSQQAVRSRCGEWEAVSALLGQHKAGACTSD